MHFAHTPDSEAGYNMYLLLSPTDRVRRHVGLAGESKEAKKKMQSMKNIGLEIELHWRRSRKKYHRFSD